MFHGIKKIISEIIKILEIFMIRINIKFGDVKVTKEE